ncbi:MAG: MFS transporter [Coriobacteriales bacterium]
MNRANAKPVLAVLYLAAFVSAFNENIINVALMDIMAEFSIASTTAQWMVTGYMIVTSIIVTVMAFLSRRFTTRTLFFIGAACLVAGEAVCMVAGSFPLLLASRLLQAVGSGIFIPLMMTSVLALAPGEKVGSYLAIGSAAITLGPALAPVLSGVAVTFFGWSSIFVLPGAVTLVLALAAIRAVVNIGETGPARFDVLSLVLAALGLTLFVYGLGEVSARPAIGIVITAVAVCLIVLFIRRQGRIDNPILNVSPLKKKRFNVSLLLVVVGMMTTFSMSVLLPLYFESVFGLSPLAAGLLILPPIVVNAVTAVFGGRVMDRSGAWPLIPVGFALIAAGQVATAVFGAGMGLVPVVASSVVVYAGVGLVMSPSQTAGLKELVHEEHPHGVSIINTIIMVSASFGPSLFIGALSSKAASAQAQGVAAAVAQASGFGVAVWIAAAIAIAGLVVSVFFALRGRVKI